MLDKSPCKVVQYNLQLQTRRCGGTGRRTGLKILRDLTSRAGSIPAICTNDVSVRTNRIELIQNQSENKIWLIFLLPKNNIKIIQTKGLCRKLYCFAEPRGMMVRHNS